MRGETYVMRDGKIVPKSTAAPLSRGFSFTGKAMSDISEFVTQDGKPIGSRSALREYERVTGTKQVGNDHATFHRELRAKVYGER